MAHLLPFELFVRPSIVPAGVEDLGKELLDRWVNAGTIGTRSVTGTEGFTTWGWEVVKVCPILSCIPTSADLQDVCIVTQAKDGFMTCTCAEDTSCISIRHLAVANGSQLTARSYDCEDTNYSKAVVNGVFAIMAERIGAGVTPIRNLLPAITIPTRLKYIQTIRPQATEEDDLELVTIQAPNTPSVIASSDPIQLVLEIIISIPILDSLGDHSAVPSDPALVNKTASVMEVIVQLVNLYNLRKDNPDDRDATCDAGDDLAAMLTAQLGIDADPRACPAEIFWDIVRKVLHPAGLDRLVPGITATTVCPTEPEEHNETRTHLRVRFNDEMELIPDLSSDDCPLREDEDAETATFLLGSVGAVVWVSNGLSGDGEVAAPRSFRHRYGMPSYREEKDYKYDTVLGATTSRASCRTGM
jgi:hypothetical protein